MASVLTAVLALTLLSAAHAAHANGLWRLLDGAQAHHPNALWHIVHDLCVTDMKASGVPAPCAAVNRKGGYAVLKDPQGRTQYLLVPTARVTGIESPQLMSRGSPNYWQAAWSSRRLIEGRVGRAIPRQDLGLAVNSIPGRTQNQLHIHIDCVRRDVRDTLEARAAEIGMRWAPLPLTLLGDHYQARWVKGAELGTNDPFKLLASADFAARGDMGQETLVVLGAVGRSGAPGFVVLSGRADQGVATGEELLDHGCEVLGAPSA
jgi:CDP-diacylglycerol pyrophosphatase